MVSGSYCRYPSYPAGLCYLDRPVLRFSFRNGGGLSRNAFLMREVGYDSAFLFKYSERPGTYAAQHLPDTVSEEEKVRRLQGMIDLQNQLSEESNKRDIGKVFEVLIEGFSKRSREQLFGRTSQNKVVIFDKKNYRVGQFIKVRINRASSATLFGDPVE